ncbi:MAG: hypothetical protein OXB93_02825 [Cytophagales bacterium]|nr:hypothetical protein [Cytophagales bacterium]
MSSFKNFIKNLLHKISMIQEISGLAEVKASLYEILKRGRLSHAYLFHGVEGTAALPMLWGFLHLLFCEAKTDEGLSCGQCVSCRKIAKWIHSDVHVFPPLPHIKGGGKQAIQRQTAQYAELWRRFIRSHPYGSYENWFSFLQSELGTNLGALSVGRREIDGLLSVASLSPYEGKYTCLVIWLPEYLHHASLNALLKTVEDPPSRTLFFFVSQKPEQIPPTLYSRFQPVSIRPFTRSELVQELVKRENIDPTRAEEIAGLSSGRYTQATHLLNMEEEAPQQNRSSHPNVYNWLRTCWKGDYVELHGQSEWFQKQSLLQQQGFFFLALHLLREVLLSQAGADSLFCFPGNLHVFAVNLSKTLSHTDMIKLYQVLQDVLRHLEQHAESRLLFLDSSLKVVSIFNRTRQVHQSR